LDAGFEFGKMENEKVEWGENYAEAWGLIS
jgi:hypothetical protein